MNNNNNQIEASNSTSRKTTKFFSLTYHQRLDNELKKILKSNDIKIASKPNYTNRSVFKKIKRKTNILNENNTVYEIKCVGNERERCNLSYIGTSMRKFPKEFRNIKRINYTKGKLQH